MIFPITFKIDYVLSLPTVYYISYLYIYIRYLCKNLHKYGLDLGKLRFPGQPIHNGFINGLYYSPFYRGVNAKTNFVLLP